MILDSSVLIALVHDEPDRESLLAKLDAGEILGVGAPTLVEAAIVLEARIGSDASGILDNLIRASGAVVIEFGEAHWREAIGAWRRFGMGRHPASLNFGDCLAYAVARVADEPLLAKGQHFQQTDLQLA